MPDELEAKYRVSDGPDLNLRLSARFGPPLRYVFERNWMLDRPDGELRSGGRGLRVRLERDLASTDPDPPRTLLTYKGPRRESAADAAAGLKQREECESSVAEHAAVLTIFERLGYKIALQYEKRRAAWRPPGALVTLDELPELGWYLEIEAASRGRLEELRAQLGIAKDDAVLETYVELAVRHGQSTPHCRHVLAFPAALEAPDPDQP